MSFDRQTYFDIISGKRTDFFARLCRVGLSLLEIPYSMVVRIRNFMFDKGLRKIHKLDVPVISVGNLTVGGTGKTPFVAWLAQKFLDEGKLPAIVSRGYHADETGWNDEAKELKLLLPDVPQTFSKNRFAASQKLLAEYNFEGSRRKIDVIILDDGFQHRKLYRNSDVLLVDATNPFGYHQMSPRGLLREPVSGAKRADVIVLTRADAVGQAEKNKACRILQQLTEKKIAETSVSPRFLLFADQKKADIETLAGANVLAFCGLGNPGVFFRTVAECGCNVKTCLTFSDHHFYTRDDIKKIYDFVTEGEIDYFICSLKDMVKLQTLEFSAAKLCAIVIKANVAENIWHAIKQDCI